MKCTLRNCFCLCLALLGLFVTFTPAISDDTLDSLDALYPTYSLPSWTNIEGWDKVNYYYTIQTADITGDGADELFGVGPNGLEVWTMNKSAGVWSLLFTGLGKIQPDVSDRTYYKSLFTADIDGDNKAEILTRGTNTNDLEVWTYNHAKHSLEWLTSMTMPEYFWMDDSFYGTLHAADLFGTGKEAVIFRYNDGIRAVDFETQGVGTPKAHYYGTTITTFRSSNVGPYPQYYKSIRVDDLDGDGKEEVWAWGTNGMEIWRAGLVDSGKDSGKLYWESTMSGDTNVIQPDNPADASVYQTWQAADLDGDNVMEIIYAEDSQIYAYKYEELSYWQLAGQFKTAISSKDWDQYSPTLRSAVISTGGKASLAIVENSDSEKGLGVIGLDDNGLSRWFTASVMNTDKNWMDEDRHYAETLMFADVDGDGIDEMMVRGSSGMRTYELAGEGTHSPDMTSASAAFTDYGSGEQAAAYKAILSYLASEGKIARGDDLRDLYPVKDIDWGGVALALGGAITKPASVSDSVWQDVLGQIKTEVSMAQDCQKHYETLRSTVYSYFYELGVQSETAYENVSLGGDKDKTAEYMINLTFNAIFDTTMGIVAAAIPEEALLVEILRPAVQTFLGSVLSRALGVVDVSGSGATLSIEAARLNEALGKWFEDSLVNMDETYDDAMSSWGNMQTLHSSVVSAQSVDILEEFDKGLNSTSNIYARSHYQALMPLKYVVGKVFHSPLCAIHWYYCLGRTKHVSEKVYEHTQGYYYVMVTHGRLGGSFPAETAPDELMEAIAATYPEGEYSLGKLLFSEGGWKFKTHSYN